MATLNVGNRPDVTKEKALEAFRKRFEGTYKVYPTRVMLRDFIIEKSATTGVGVRVKQDDDGTTFVYSAMVPNPIVRALGGGLIGGLIMRGSFAMEDEVTQFIKQEFGSGG